MAQLRPIVDKLLTNVSQMLQAQGHICEALLPSVTVKEKSGLLGKYGKSHLRIETSFAGGRGKFRRVESIVRSSQRYELQSHGLEGVVTEDDYDNVEKPFDAESDETIGLTSHIYLEKEKVLADALADTGVITQNVTLSGTSQFSDYANSSPLSRASAARVAVRAGCGTAPDTAWMDWAVKNVLKFHPELLERLGYTQARPGGLSDDELAKALDVKQVLVAEAMYNSAKEGQSDSLAAVWGKHLWFGVCPKVAQVRQVSMGYLVKKGSPRQVTKYNIDNPGATGILVKDQYGFMIADVGAVYLIKNAIA